MRRSEAWYTAALRARPHRRRDPDDGSGHLTLGSISGGWVLALSGPASPAVRHVAFTCVDRGALVAWRDALASKDVAPGTITDAPYGSGFVVRDPDGLELELFAPPSASLAP